MRRGRRVKSALLYSAIALSVVQIPAVTYMYDMDFDAYSFVKLDPVSTVAIGSAAAATRPRDLKIISLNTAFGQGTLSGLTNQRCMFFSVVLEALQKKAALDVSSLRYRGSWNVTSSIPHADLYDIDHWNDYATRMPGSLPLLVSSSDLQISNYTNLEHAGVRMDLRFVDSAKIKQPEHNAVARHINLALRPAESVRKIIDSLKPKGEYGAIHLRVEADLKQAKGFWERRVSIRQAFVSLEQNKVVSQCMANRTASKIYAAVAIRDVHDPDDLSILRSRAGPWPGTHLEFDAAKKAASRYGEASNIVGALVDWEIVRQATAFASGHFELSTFSRTVADSRVRFFGDAPDRCRHLFFDYSTNRTYEDLALTMRWPARRASWQVVPQDAAPEWQPSSVGMGSLLLRNITATVGNGSRELSLKLEKVLESHSSTFDPA